MARCSWRPGSPWTEDSGRGQCRQRRLFHKFAFTKVDLDALLNQYGVTSADEREWLETLSRGAREHGWWEIYHDDIVAAYLNFVGYEAGAAFVRQYPGTVLPGLLQTREYAEALTATSVYGTRIAPVVRLRLQRQSELAKRETPPRQHYVLDEAAIRRHVGIQANPVIMPDQLRSIVERARTDEWVTVQVIPFAAGAHAGLSGPFTLLEFDGALPEILYLDAGRGTIGMLNSTGPEVAEYACSFQEMLASALPAGESLELISAAAADMS